ncbi:tRNA-modifying protein YgfZ [Vibrio sonorensis]|uniref:tRNA-modifying protein YgfZ n=1 Tax=Vibrio sonorensis TaxID=1004316 RepID=UPI0008D91640|nr:tRNA-modifying protein YgfZ [Vibrio sonorensis]
MELQQDMTELLSSTQTKQPSLLFCPLDSWGLIAMTGDDKVSYLQGQVTCDIVTLDKEASTFGAHCDAKGKVWSAFRLFHHRDGYAMFQPESAIETELTELKKYSVFSKVEFERSQDVMIGLIGIESNDWIDQNTSEKGQVRTFLGGAAVQVEDNRWLIAIDQSEAEKLINEHKEKLAGEEFWTLADIRAGFPIVHKEQQNTHIPQALNLQVLDGISFTKGCYTGQETVARAKYRGMNKRALFIVQGDTTTTLPDDTPIEMERAVGENWRSAGQLLTHVEFSDNQAIGLIILPKDSESDMALRLKSQPETNWKLLPLPYSLEEE